jgi:short-subunit dehydrogenase
LGANFTQIYPIDITNPEKFLLILEKITKQYSIDLCIHAAGITSLIGKNETYEDINHCEKLINTNLTSAITLTNFLLSKMIKKNKGHMVYFSSLASYYGMAYTPAYCASKAGIRLYAEATRQYTKGSNVTISVIMMGFVKSNMSNQFQRAKPFLLDTEKAACYIKKGIDQKKAYIRFPFLLQWAVRLQSILPYKLADWLMIQCGYGKK